jgi:hypothetical protein
VEHTILVNGTRQGHKGGLVLSQLHIALAVGFAIVACLTAFGGGIIVGMWYKVGEQIAPVSPSVTSTPAESPAQSQETVSQPPEPPAPVTFYNTLTSSNVAYAPLAPPPAPATGPTSGAQVTPAGSTPARGAVPGGAKGSTPAASVSKATSTAAGTTRTATVSESQKHTKATPAAKAAPAETAAPPGGTKTAARKPAAPTRQAGKGTGAQQQAGTATPAKASGVEDVRGPVGSAGDADKGSLARVQPAAVPGQGSRYRARVGGYAERTAADQTAQRLTAQEQVPAIVAGRD